MGACCCIGGSVPGPQIQQTWICLGPLTAHLSTNPVTLVVTSGMDTGLTELPCIAWHILSQILCARWMVLLCSSWEQGRGRFLLL